MTSDVTKSHLIDADREIFITPKGRIGFVALGKKWKGQDAKPDDRGQFALTLLVGPDVDIKPMKDAILRKAKAVFGGDIDPFVPAKAKGVKCPIRKAEERYTPDQLGLESLDGWHLITANSYRDTPPITRTSRMEVVSVDDVDGLAYPGRYARMEVALSHYTPKGDNDGKGIKFYLNSVQLLRDADRWEFGPTASTGDAYGAVDDEDEVNLEDALS